jgi:hypothetical protein
MRQISGEEEICLWGLQVFGNQLKVTIGKVHRAIDYKAATRSQNHEAEDPIET